MEVAKSLARILENPLVRASLDRSQPSDPLIDKVKELWGVDLDKRRPAPAYVDGVDGQPIYQGSDFDLFTFLMALAQRRAVINLPTYERFRKGSKKASETVVSRENRHGEITALVSNQEVHSFSVRIIDYNVIKTPRGLKEEVGAHRSFGIVDVRGRLYDGWKGLEFTATDEERKFFKKHGLYLPDGNLEFEHFVHPSLAMAFYGSRYVATKALANRLVEETRACEERAEYLMKKKSVKLPPRERPKKEEYLPDESAQKTVRVRNLVARLELPEFTGSFPKTAMKEDGSISEYEELPDKKRDLQNVLRYNLWRVNQLRFHLGYFVRTPVRAVELAFFLHGFKRSRTYGEELKPGWPVPDFERNWRIHNSNDRWNNLHFCSGVDLAYRLRHSSEAVLDRPVQAVLFE